MEAIRSLNRDRSIVIKKVDKGYRVVVWDRLMQAGKQLKIGNLSKKSRLAKLFLLIWPKK